MAGQLRGEGVELGDRVAIFCDRSIDVPGVVMGILLAGAVFLPLETTDPVERRREVLAQAGCRLMVTDGRPAPSECRAIAAASSCAHAPLQEPPSCRPLDAAAVMFTSGSTGRPKGAVIPHRAIIRLVRHPGFMSFSPATRFLFASPLAFDASTLELWGPLLNGGTVVVAPAGTLGLREIAETIRTRGVNTCWLTAALFRACVDEIPELFAPLDTVLTGGDVVSPRHVALLRSQFPALQIINGYGPTENTTFTTCHRIDGTEVTGPIPIGVPINNSSVAIVDERMQLLPRGDAGELIALGDGLALGYLNDSEETARRFVWLSHLQQRGYRTGDRARLRPDGRIEFLGRMDDQVKIRGHRVEPMEAELLLRSLPGVREAAVVAYHRNSDASLAAFVLAEDSHDWPETRDRLMRSLRAALPTYLIPDSIARCEHFPVGATGKIDRSALRDRVEQGTRVAQRWHGSPAALAVATLRLADAWHPYGEPGISLHLGDEPYRFTCADFKGLGTAAIVTQIGQRVPHANAVGTACRVELESPEGTAARIEAEDDVRLILAPETSDRLIEWRVEHVRNALEATRSDKPTSPDAWSPVGSDERRCLQAVWNDTDWEHGYDRSLVHLFEEVAQQKPDAEAARSADVSRTFAFLLARTNAVAAQVMALGVRPGDRVGVIDDRSIDAIIAVVGVLRAGAACVPIDPATPAQRIAAILADAEVDVVLHARDGGPASGCERATVVACCGDCEVRPPGVEVALDSTAFVMFTSGSTGRPKGVPLRHEALLNHIAWRQRAHPLQSDDLVMQQRRLSWDVSIWEYLWPLAFGGRFFVADAATAGDPSRLLASIRENHVTILHMVPSLLAPLTKAARGAARSTIRLTICSGEALSTTAANDYLRTIGGELHNQYGPTETSEVTMWQCRPESITTPIGMPVANTQIAIQDPAGRMCGVGVVGELCIGGVQVAHGYLDVPGVDQRAFVPDPSCPSRSVYRTGDLAFWREDGVLEFSGRRDAQVQLCGFRIEVEEVEATLRQYEPIADAAVCKLGTEMDAELVAVCVVPGPQGTVDWRGVRQHLQTRLDGPMVPTRFVRVDSLPRLSSGKLDRQRIATLAADDKGTAAPNGTTTTTLDTLSAVWTSILGQPPATPDEDFTSAGGDSLSLLRLLLETERQLGIAIPTAPAISEPTPTKLAAVIDSVAIAAQSAAPAGSEPESDTGGGAEQLVRLTYGPTSLVMLPHLGGTLGFLNEMALDFEGTIGLFGLKPRGLFGGAAPMDNVADQAAACAALIAKQNFDSVCVAGFSSGAIVAVEVAIELAARQIQVPWLLVIDGSLEHTAVAPYRTPIAAVRHRLRPVKRLLRRKASVAPDEPVLAKGLRAGPQAQLVATHRRALRAHIPRPYNGRALVIATRGSGGGAGRRSWCRVLRGPTDELLLEGTHMGIWKRPAVAALSRAILQRVSSCR